MLIMFLELLRSDFSKAGIMSPGPSEILVQNTNMTREHLHKIYCFFLNNVSEELEWN